MNWDRTRKDADLKLMEKRWTQSQWRRQVGKTHKGKPNQPTHEVPGFQNKTGRQ